MIATDAVMYPEPSKLRAKAAKVRFAVLLSAFFTASGSTLVQADAYTDLDAAGKSYVKRVCMPVQHMKNTAAFRECVVQHSNAIATAPTLTLASLNVDERIAQQRDCSLPENQNASSNSNCGPGKTATTQAVTTSVTPEPIVAPKVANLNDSTVVEQPTAAAALPTVSTEVGAITDKLNDSLQDTATDSLEIVTGDDAVDMAVEALAIPAAPSVPRTPNTPAANAVQTLATTSDVSTEPLSNESTETAQTVAESTETNDASIVLAQNTAQTSSEPSDSTAADTETGSTPTDDAANDGFDASEAPVDVAKRMWTQLLASFEGVSGINKIIVLAAAALPLLLIGFWLLMRGRKKEPEYIPPPHPSALRDRVRARADDDLDDTLDTAADHSVASQQMYEDQVNELFADDDDPVLNDDIDETVAISPSLAPSVAAEDQFSDEFSFEPDTTTETPKKAEAHDNHGMHSWLNSLEESEQLSIAIEFMIYWMAYTDERYQPELKKSVFSLDDPDDHDLVKRRVLNQDTAAFAETTSWLQENTSAEQRVQIINLLMALLVSEEAITPVQNTMLRFLSNAFGMSHEQLDEMFQKAFAESLPPMPRPDKPSWWEQQPTDKLKRWDARSVAQQSQTIQSRVKLGLPLTGSLNAEDLDGKYERAISRCQPEWFDLLSEREQQLAEQQQFKFETAFDILKEVSA